MQSSVVNCRLICLQKSHDDILLLDKTPVKIGRSPQTKIKDPRCSRNQVELTADWAKKKVSVQQLGANLSSVDGEVIGQKQTVDLSPGSTLFILSGQFPHVVKFDVKTETDNFKVPDGAKIERSTVIKSEHSDDSVTKTSRNGDMKGTLKAQSKSSHKRQSSDKLHVGDAKKRKTESESDRKDMVSTDKKTLKISDRKPSVDEEEKHVTVIATKLEEMKKNVKKEKSATGMSSQKESNDTPKKPGSLNSSIDSSPSSSKKPLSPSSKKLKPTETATWTTHDQLYVYTSKGVVGRKKIAGFDLDGTIIKTKSGKTFPTDEHDWQICFPEIFGKLKSLLASEYKITFFTNQLGVAKGRTKIDDLKVKVENVVRKLQVPVQVFIATQEGRYRKPVDGMWKKLEQQYNDGVDIDRSSSIYVGDAAGRPANWAPKKKKDFSLSDRLFALNIKVKFQTPEEFFLNYKPAEFTMPKFDPRELKSDAQMVPPKTQLAMDSKEVALLVGFPACGKSFFASKFFKPKGYVVVNRDTCGSWQKCVKITSESLVNSSVVVDNTNLTPEERLRYIECARIAGVSCRCFVFNTTLEHCRHNERHRQMTDGSHAKINEMIFNTIKSKYIEPSMKEGFSDIIAVNFVPHFSSPSKEANYRKFLLEK